VLSPARFFEASQGWQALEPIRGEWKGPTAGGCTNYDTVKDNPQYLLTVTKQTNVVINLAQTDSRGTSSKLQPIAIEIYNNKGNRITRTRTGPLIGSNPESCQ
jgi:pectate lyase